MTWIDLPDDEANAQLSRLTASYRRAGRPVPAIVAAMKPSPSALRAVMQMNNAITFGGSVLGARREEMIATVVSGLNDCFY